MTLGKLLLFNRRPEDFVPPGYRLIQQWTAHEWAHVWKEFLDRRPPAWKTLPRAIFEQLERLSRGNLPDYVRNGLLFYEVMPLIARVEDDVERERCWRPLVEHEMASSAASKTPP